MHRLALSLEVRVYFIQCHAGLTLPSLERGVRDPAVEGAPGVDGPPASDWLPVPADTEERRSRSTLAVREAEMERDPAPRAMWEGHGSEVCPLPWPLLPRPLPLS